MPKSISSVRILHARNHKDNTYAALKSEQKITEILSPQAKSILWCQQREEYLILAPVALQLATNK